MISQSRILVSDLEGTLLRKAVRSTQGIAPSVWTLLAQHLGPEALLEEEETKRKWNEGEYPGYVAWMADTIRIHQKYGLTKSFFDQVMGLVLPHEGVKETYAQIRELGYITAVISGGFKAQADKVQQELGIDHSFAACEYFWEGEQLVHWNLLPCDYAGKADFMHLLMQHYNANPADCVFIGDGPNDKDLAQLVGNSIAFNADPKLEQVSQGVIRQEQGQEDFRAVLDYLSMNCK